ncbi:uncharacterized protein FOMMEDRAFT_108083 [Fomitiporia mediterranea MF3/22]|uniref:uncharacterized protein n=1 Tax=Fomitiporia mediterranea (strain MF3/22) TaxID=694068 RepID=UPI000440934F|nr:uncharacterized protein FOMMEDRAFT_108083 [Fomitiporia mediterranea MF3/22]EJD03005.1 hypothetical protein FOMMEDRAFT_108083 [Fomitiporia mediterranea MF3/22]
MSALRAISRPARSLPSFTRQRRLASTTSAHDPHHHAEEHDPNVYQKEHFFTPFWRRTALITLGCIAYAKFAPEDFKAGKTTADGEYEPPWLTRVLAHYAPSVKEWVKTNERHLAQTEERAQNTLVVQSAKLPPKATRQIALQFEQVSPHRVPVGGMPDMSDLVIKP